MAGHRVDLGADGEYVSAGDEFKAKTDMAMEEGEWGDHEKSRQSQGKYPPIQTPFVCAEEDALQRLTGLQIDPQVKVEKVEKREGMEDFKEEAEEEEPIDVDVEPEADQAKVLRWLKEASAHPWAGNLLSEK
jgi:hypothetical protein